MTAEDLDLEFAHKLARQRREEAVGRIGAGQTAAVIEGLWDSVLEFQGRTPGEIGSKAREVLNRATRRPLEGLRTKNGEEAPKHRG